MKAKKTRLDKMLVERELVESREQAQRLIMAGKVRVNQEIVTKAGLNVSNDSEIEILESERYVSRGGYKLAAALKEFKIDVGKKVAADIGASTGGFTDCLLQYGACKVYAIDVGYGQLHWRLRQDKRVVVLEKVNARYLTEDSLPEKVDIATIDVSFISLSLILPGVKKIIKPEAEIICLIKPQFEASREKVGSGGVIKDPRVHKEVLEKFVSEVQQELLAVVSIMASPIPGADGNREYLAHLKPSAGSGKFIAEINLEEIIGSAFSNFKN